VWATLLSLFAFVSSRFAFSTIVPLRWDKYTTWAGVAVGVVAAVVMGLDKPKIGEDPKVTVKDASWWTDCRLGIGFGSLLFLSHWILTAHGIFARWIDLDPFVIGILMMLSMVVGILVNKHPFVRTWTWWLIAILSGPALLSPTLPKQVAIVFGLVIIVYLTSLWRVTITDLSDNARVVRSLAVAGIVYLLGNLALIWSIAYCFVPEGTGGPFMRERSGQVFCLYLHLVGLAYFKSPKNKTENRGKHTTSYLPPKTILMILVIILLFITLPAVIKRAYV